MAAATGQEINVPIIIRSLARDFYRSAVQQDYSIPLDREFLLALDGGLGTLSGRHIEKFELSWWNLSRLITQKDILSIYTIEKCLAFHRKQVADSGAGNNIPPDGGRFHRPAYIWKQNADKPVTESDKCPRCRLYRAVALGMQDEHRDIKNLVRGMDSSFAENKNQSMRRASGFNQLFEFLSIKEQDPLAETEFSQAVTPSSYPEPQLSTENIALPDLALRSKKGKRVAGRRDLAERTRQEAIAGVKRMSNMASLKWTWGADLDPMELRSLRRAADTGHQLPHSGYDMSLTHGPTSRSDSPVLSAAEIDDTGYFSDVGEDIQPVPDLDNIPSPLALRSHLPPIQTSMHTPSSSKTASPTTAAATFLADDSSPSSSDVTPAMAMAAYLGSHSPHSSASSSSSVTPAMAMAAYLGSHSPHSSASSSSSEVTPARAMAAYLGNHSPPVSVVEDEHSSSDSSVDAATAAAVFDPPPNNLRGLSIEVDPTQFTLHPPGGVFTPEYFSFVEEDWIE
jgi:hypothetical protein